MNVEYIDHIGSDERVCDAARVSFNKSAENYTKEQNDKLIKYLADHNHFVPFTHPQITLRETVPIFVSRQRFKHTVGFSYSEVSRRYVDDTPEFYTPEFWRGRPEGSVKQGSSDEVITEIERPDFFNSFKTKKESIHTAYETVVRKCTLLYQDVIKAGVAPEQARMVLPQSMYTSYYTTGSLYAFARAYKLRIDPHAQKEIQEIAVEWDKIIRPLFPVSWEALTS